MAVGPRPLEARFLHNPRYAELNNFHTLALACEQRPAGRLLALNADIVFHSWPWSPTRWRPAAS